ncbi:MAG: hypothetical protein IIA23_08670 [Chloroflexi bacterium]|nr:hypothetical protein [Chloroflexota bacterium]
MTRGEAVTALLDTWVEELGDDAAQGLLFGLLLARADPTLANLVERGVEEMQEEAALDALERVDELSWDDPDVAFFLALAHISLGDDGSALGELKKAVVMGYPVTLIAAEPGFAGIRQDAGFMEITKIGLH